jgi:hypothetical protein
MILSSSPCGDDTLDGLITPDWDERELVRIAFASRKPPIYGGMRDATASCLGPKPGAEA